MNPDEQSAFSKGNGDAVVSAVRLWAARDGIHLRIDTAGADAQATVTNEPGSVKDRRILFGDLRRVLMANGCWGLGDEAGGGKGALTVED
ncbi:MAG TPA: hypothetical protein VFW30_00540 [Bryocella sp.]|nr:hypothetical protein [Bryocella sp.]